MSLDFSFSLEDLEAAEAATANPYLNDPAKGLQLIARLVGQSRPDASQEQQRRLLAELHQLIHERFIELTGKGSYPGEAQALRELLALEESLENLALFPDLANKTVIGVGGGFSAGKSRLLNTLLGIDLLPESLEPTTAIPSLITRGDDGIVALNSFNQQIPLDRDGLSAITHTFAKHYQHSLDESFGFAHVLKLLMLHHPDFAWDNLAFLDTPGYSKADAQGASQTDEGIALEQLSEADHAIWLLSAKNGSIRQDDLEFLRTLDHPRPIFFVVTQADLVGRSRIDAILHSTAEAIAASGIPCAGLMAWAAPLGSERGELIAGDDIRDWLGQLDNLPKYIAYRSTCERILDGYICHNQDELTGSRKKLALLNTLLPLADRLPETERSTLRELIQEQRSNQKLFAELAESFEALRKDTLEVIGRLLGHLAINVPASEVLFKKGQDYYEHEQYELAVTCFHQAAEQGHTDAQFHLGKCYYFGQGVTEDESNAVAWFRKTAEQGLAGAQYYLGECYYLGLGIPENKNLAVDWFRKAAEQDHAYAQFTLGYCYFDRGAAEDKSSAVAWFRKAAEQGQADAQFHLGECYYDGQGISADKNSALTWFHKAAEQGQTDAQFTLGCCYFDRGAAGDKSRAVAWFRKAAEQGHADAQFRLGECYYDGQGVAEDKSSAAIWFRKAAEQ
ncbi:dynamin family protein, partial [Azotobacter beijerinckii]